MDFNGRYEKQSHIEVECPACGEINVFQDDETLHEDTLVCCECESEFTLAHDENEVANVEVDLSVPQAEEVVANVHAFILEHCESNNHLLDILEDFYHTAFIHGMKATLVTQIKSNMEAIQVLDSAQ